MEVYLIPPKRANSPVFCAANYCVTQQLLSSPPVHHSIHPPSIARACGPCDGAARRGIKPPVESIQGLSSLTKKIWRHHEISYFALPANSCSGCIVNLDGPCQRLQQYDAQGHLGQ